MIYPSSGEIQPVGRYAYNELGELIEKWQGCKLQVVNYQTDLRGRLTAINNTANPVLLKKKNQFFGQVLQYDLLDNVQNQQWGNVASLAKAAPVSSVSRGYTYNYDPINRLKGAVYAGATGEDFSLSNLNYDRNGNITTMQRAASTPGLGSSPAEDNLSYTYATNTNRLINVVDAGVAASSGKKAHYFNDRNISGSDYAYDAAGNLVKDLNREITYIGYNVLGLPEEIRFTNNAKIFYLYTASGAKLQKQGAYLPGATPGSTLQKKIDYLAAGVFADNALTFIPTAEGRALPPNTALGGTAFRYEYQQTDHLDNLRTACRCGEKLDSLGNVVALLPSDNLRNLVQENSYDPWGLNLPDLERSAVLPDWWQFSTKERDYRAYDEFEFRHYDAAIGRFMSIDPLFQQFRGISPFNYADNNPSTLIDLYGLQGTTPGPPGKVTAFGSSGSAVVGGGGLGGFFSGLGNGLNAIGNFLSTPLGSAVNFGIQASNALNQPASAATYNLNALKGGCPPNCPTRNAVLREYKPDVYDLWRDGNIGQQLVYGVADGVYSLFNDNHLGGRGFDNYDDKIKTRLGGLLSLTGPLSSEVNAIKTATKGRVFWSGNGNPTVFDEATKFAQSQGMTTLEMTRAGQNLQKLTEGLPWEQAKPMWERLSAAYAKGASGEIHVFHNASGGINIKSVWGTIEFPILKRSNSKIIYHNIK